MAKKSQETLIKERIEELQSSFADMATEKMKIVYPMLVRLAKMEFYLKDLEKQIDDTGFVEIYTNGPNQSGTRESIVSRSYSTVIKNYNSLVRTLLTQMPEEERKEISDGLDEFLQRRDDG